MKIDLEFLTRIRVAYLFGIGLLVTVVVSAYFVVDSSIRNREQDAALINTIGVQRMWSQRVLLLATRLANPDDAAGIADSRTKLGEALSAMRANHDIIRTALRTHGAAESYSAVQAFYFSGTAPLSDWLRTYLADVERVVALPDDRQVARALEPDAPLREAARELLQVYQSAVDFAVAANQAFAAQHRARIVVDGELPALRVGGDRDRLIQVLTNLLSNAAKFTPPGGSVHVTLEKREAGARLAVRDEGPGIAAEFQSRLFQKFSQADSTDTRSKGGTGLGLSITKAIVERHGGKIGYESTEGKGTTFFVDLPLRAAVAQTSEKTGPRILVVEDDPDIAKLLRLMLEQHGYAVDTAGTAAEARECLAVMKYAAVTLDLLLPGESGISFLRALRARLETAALPVIVVSAVAERGREQVESAAVPMLDWLEKPIDEQRLLRAVSRAVKTGPRKGRRVLHVEADADIATIIGSMLAGVADIDVAASLSAARKSLATGDYSLVILDVGLPDGSGLDLLPQIHAAEPPIPVLVFSAYELDEEVRDQVSAAFVKSHSDEGSLVRAIRASLEESSAVTVEADPTVANGRILEKEAS